MRNLYTQRVGRALRNKRDPFRRPESADTPWRLIAVLFAGMILLIVLLNHMDAQLCAAVEAGDAPANRYTGEICNQQ